MSHDLLLNLKDLACGYASQKVVQDLDLHLNAGDIGCLLGPSGCGKTTTARHRRLRAGAGRADRTGRRSHLASRLHPGAGETPDRHGVPGLRAVPASQRGRQCRLRHPQASTTRAPGARASGAGQARPPRRAPPPRTLRRPATTGGPGPRAGARTAVAAARRTLLQPRRGTAPQPQPGGSRDPQGTRHQRDPGDPRPGRSLRRLRPHRRVQGRSPGTVDTPTTSTTSR